MKIFATVLAVVVCGLASVQASVAPKGLEYRISSNPRPARAHIGLSHPHVDDAVAIASQDPDQSNVRKAIKEADPYPCKS